MLTRPPRAKPASDALGSEATVVVGDLSMEIRVFSLMGGSNIVVPSGVQVELSGFAFMEGNRLRLEDTPTPPAGAPVVRVRAYSVMGGTDVKSGLPPAPDDRVFMGRRRPVPPRPPGR